MAKADKTQRCEWALCVTQQPPALLKLKGLNFETSWGWQFELSAECDKSEEPNSGFYWWTITVRPPENETFQMASIHTKDAGWLCPAVYKTHGTPQHALNYAEQIAEFYK